MTSRRAPLSNLPNATNSPLRKRPRADGKPIFEDIHDPPAKRQNVGLENMQPQTPRKERYTRPTEDLRQCLEHARRKQIVELRDERVAIPVSKDARSAEDREHIQRWQRYYQKQFPHFVFYFESVPEDQRRLCSRQVKELGAKEEKFFSKIVTHVITTRPSPSDSECSTPVESQHTSTQENAIINSHSRTINPSLLDKSSSLATHESKFNFDAILSKKRALPTSPDKGARKTAAPKVDVLQKAKDLGMKIWQLEKLHRMLKVMYEEQDVSGSPEEQITTNAPAVARTSKHASLSQMMRHDQLGKTGGRELNLANIEVVSLKEPYIIVRDMNEKTKPIMVRQYTKVAHYTDGDWPQFRPVPMGKCPFVQELESRKGKVEKARQTVKAQPEPAQRVTRAQTHAAEAEQQQYEHELERMRNRKQTIGRQLVRQEVTNVCEEAGAQTTEPQVQQQAESQPMAPPLLPKANPLLARPGGEPLASGMQRSGMTSAIRSNFGSMSSTAPAPSLIRAGTSRDVHTLQRRVLERNSTESACGGASLGNPTSWTQPTNGLVRSNGMMDIAGATRAVAAAAAEDVTGQRKAKTKAQEKLRARQALGEIAGNSRAKLPEVEKRKEVKVRREPKAGYCENCREKFEDFEEHTQSRRHRKFATGKENWAELDQLLMSLQRPLRKRGRDDTESDEEHRC